MSLCVYVHPATVHHAILGVVADHAGPAPPAEVQVNVQGRAGETRTRSAPGAVERSSSSFYGCELLVCMCFQFGLMQKTSDFASGCLEAVVLCAVLDVVLRLGCTLADMWLALPASQVCVCACACVCASLC